MTRRILLTLADDTTAELCGSCEHVTYGHHGSASPERVCRVYDLGIGSDVARNAECLAAERDARKLEVSK